MFVVVCGCVVDVGCVGICDDVCVVFEGCVWVVIVLGCVVVCVVCCLWCLVVNGKVRYLIVSKFVDGLSCLV